jgi:hypothetical protein
MNKLNYWSTYLFSLILILGLTNCALPPQRGASQRTSFAEEGKKTPRGQVTQAELQDDLSEACLRACNNQHKLLILPDYLLKERSIILNELLFYFAFKPDWVHEVLDDAGLSLAQISSPLEHENTVRNLLKEFQQTLLITRATLGDANSTVKSVNTLMNQLSKNPQTADSATATLTQLTVLLKEWNLLLSSAHYQKGVSQVVDIANQDSQKNKAA